MFIAGMHARTAFESCNLPFPAEISRLHNEALSAPAHKQLLSVLTSSGYVFAPGISPVYGQEHTLSWMAEATHLRVTNANAAAYHALFGADACSDVVKPLWYCLPAQLHENDIDVLPNLPSDAHWHIPNAAELAWCMFLYQYDTGKPFLEGRYVRTSSTYGDQKLIVSSTSEHILVRTADEEEAAEQVIACTFPFGTPQQLAA